MPVASTAALPTATRWCSVWPYRQSRHPRPPRRVLRPSHPRHRRGHGRHRPRRPGAVGSIPALGTQHRPLTYLRGRFFKKIERFYCSSISLGASGPYKALALCLVTTLWPSCFSSSRRAVAATFPPRLATDFCSEKPLGSTF